MVLKLVFYIGILWMLFGCSVRLYGYLWGVYFSLFLSCKANLSSGDKKKLMDQGIIVAAKTM
jgi:hypothetical protein